MNATAACIFRCRDDDVGTLMRYLLVQFKPHNAPYRTVTSDNAIRPPSPAHQDHRFRLTETSSFSVLCTRTGSDDATAAPPTATNDHNGNTDDGRFRENGTFDADPRGSSIQTARAVTGRGDGDAGVVCIDVVCGYTRSLVAEGFARRLKEWRVTTDR